MSRSRPLTVVRQDGSGQPGSSKAHASHFWRHFVEMLAAMMVGMFGGAFIFLSIVGVTWEEALVQYPTWSLLVMAVGMTVPMAAWMLLRGMGRRNTLEMSAVMALPVIPFLFLVWFGITESALCGAYCGLTVLGMLGLMLYRRSEYSMKM